MDAKPIGLKGKIEMNADQKPLQENTANAEPQVKQPWQPMKMKLAGDAKDVIRHGHAKTSPGTGDPGEVLKNPQQG